MTGAQTLRVAPEGAFDALKSLREQGFNVLVDLTAVDYSAHPPSDPPRAARFEVVYRLMRLDPETGMDAGRADVHAAVPEGEAVLRSVVALFPAADWLEREVWDMFGIGFTDRPGIKRLLLYEEFAGHPLRKDYPISKRQPLIGPASGERPDNPSFNASLPAVTGE